MQKFVAPGDLATGICAPLICTVRSGKARGYPWLRPLKNHNCLCLVTFFAIWYVRVTILSLASPDKIHAKFPIFISVVMSLFWLYNCASSQVWLNLILTSAQDVRLRTPFCWKWSRVITTALLTSNKKKWRIPFLCSLCSGRIYKFVGSVGMWSDAFGEILFCKGYLTL
jgi:hypothetical protein